MIPRSTASAIIAGHHGKGIFARANDTWKINGNTGNTADHFFGTTDAMPVQIRLDSLKAGIWDGTNRNYSIGVGALDSLTTGKGNVAMGQKALFKDKTGNNNVAIGDSALLSNTVSGTVAIGSKALRSNTTGDNNTAVGYQALMNSTTSSNTAIGYKSLSSNTTGFSNTAVGSETLKTILQGWQTSL